MKKKSVLTIWDKLQLESADINKKTDDIKNESKNASNLFSIVNLGNIFGAIFWLYSIINVFFFNLDLYLISNIPPILKYVVQYKFFVFLAIIAFFSVFIKKYYLLYLYIIFFPFILLFYFILLIYKFKSWILVLTLGEIITSFLHKLKRRIIIFTATLFSMLIITVSNSVPVIFLGMLIITVVCLSSIIQTIIISFKSSIFFKSQSRIIKWFRSSSLMNSMLSIDEKFKKSKSKLTKEQSTIVINNISMALIVDRGIYYWANQLEKYRKSRVNFMLNGISYAWLFFKLVIFLSFINYGLFKIDPSSFVVKSKSFVIFLYYSLSSFFFSEIFQLVANNDISILIRFFSGITSYILLSILILNFIYVAKQTKDDRDLVQAIAEIKNEGKELENQFKVVYSFSAEEAIKKLQDLKVGLIGLILKISKQIPEDQ